MFKYLNNETWKFVDHKSIPNPVHKLYYTDLTKDGVHELVTVTAKGLHVYQVDNVVYFLNFPDKWFNFVYRFSFSA